MRRFMTISAALFFGSSCAKSSNQSVSAMDSVPKEVVTAPQLARCSQVTDVEKIQIRETLIVKILGDVVSGTYHFATGDRNTLTDTGFQHILGKIGKNEIGADNKIALKLKDATLTTYFDEDFAASKDLAEINYDPKEKKISFRLAKDERATTIGGCQFE